MLIDSHCHIHLMDLTAFDHDVAQVIALAHEFGVKEMLCVCVELGDIPKLAALRAQFPQIYISVGIHPCYETLGHFDVQTLVEYTKQPGCIAIGETGLDYYHQDTMPKAQQTVFEIHIEAARLTQKPLIIHTRDASSDTIAVMKAAKADEIGGVMHCFTESFEMAQQALDLGFYISFAGIITFKNTQALRDVVRQVPLDRLLIETDSPYLAPTPYRGKQNHPGLVKYVAQMVSEIHACDFETVAKMTTNNFYRCFRLDTP